jgi:hypothetical protein
VGLIIDNSIKQEKYRKLSIAALVLGILAWCSLITFPGNFNTFSYSFIYNFFPETYIYFILSFYVIFLSIPAIVCGSIDLKRIKAGYCNNKGIGLDIAGIVLGSAFTAFIFWIALLYLAFSQD